MIEVSLTTFQRTALSALIGENEKMVASGELSLERATTLRWLIAQTLTAFRMPAAYEREVVNDNDTAAQAAVREVMEADSHV
jgi:hypothetical protein